MAGHFIRTRTCSLVCCGILILLSFAFAASAQDFAKLPYPLIYQMELTETNLSKTYTNLYMFLRITPTAPGVRISDVEVYIDSKKGRIPVHLNPTNGVFSIPMREDLLAENTYIVTSQPKGTMSFNWYIGLTGGELPTNGIRYRELMRPVEDTFRIHREMAKIPGIPPLAIPVLKLIYANDAPASVTVRASSGDKIFQTDSSHAILIPLDPVLLTENPAVGISVPPAQVAVAEPADK